MNAIERKQRVSKQASKIYRDSLTHVSYQWNMNQFQDSLLFYELIGPDLSSLTNSSFFAHRLSLSSHKIV